MSNDGVVAITRAESTKQNVPELLQAAAPPHWQFQDASESIERKTSLHIPIAFTYNASEFNGSCGALRAPRRGCLLDANHDLDAVAVWLMLQRRDATRRAYRKEVERLMLWAIIDREKPLSSLTHEDALAYRAFLRRPVPASRWIGPVVPRHTRDWKPFQNALSPRASAHALLVLSSLFRWLTEQRYLLENPFAGLDVTDALAMVDYIGKDAPP